MHRAPATAARSVGYDVSGYRAIDLQYRTMSDFNRLVGSIDSTFLESIQLAPFGVYIGEVH